MRSSTHVFVLALALSAAACAAVGDGTGADGTGGPADDASTDGLDVFSGLTDVARVADSGTTSGRDVATPPSDTGAPPPRDSGVHTGPCVPTLPSGAHENSNALCSNGIDDDCNGYIDCDDYYCSMYTASVTVCVDGGSPPPVDAGPPPPPVDAGPPGAVGPIGGTVTLLHFAVFGDVRPPSENDTSAYPSATITSIMRNIQDLGAQFAVASGDYMFASDTSDVNSQLDMLASAESGFHNTIFHGMGNHECNGAVDSNCPLGNEYPNAIAYMSRLVAAYGHPYFDWIVHTSHGDAHFISTAPNAWSTAQQTWLTTALGHAATYTFVMEHESPDAMTPPAGAAIIESMIDSRVGGVTLKLYGHTHEYHHLTSAGANAVVDGNAGAPLDGSGTYFGFGIVDQEADGTITFTAYQAGATPMVMDSWSVTASGAAH